MANKKTYTRKQILEAIDFWKKQLNESACQACSEVAFEGIKGASAPINIALSKAAVELDKLGSNLDSKKQELLGIEFARFVDSLAEIVK